jgi:hypothetical protein
MRTVESIGRSFTMLPHARGARRPSAVAAFGGPQVVEHRDGLFERLTLESVQAVAGLATVEQLSVDEHSQMLGDRRSADLAKVLGDHPGGDLVVA